MSERERERERVYVTVMLSLPLPTGASSDPRHPVLSIQLYDTTGDSDLLINQELVEAGVAEWSTPMANISPSTCKEQYS